MIYKPELLNYQFQKKKKNPTPNRDRKQQKKKPILAEIKRNGYIPHILMARNAYFIIIVRTIAMIGHRHRYLR